MSTSSREFPETGLLTDRVEFYRENTTGQFQADPEYSYYSDNVVEFTYTPGLSIERRDGLGTPDATGHDYGHPEPEIEITYDLQRQLVDGSGNPDDASADAILRTANNRIMNTHNVRIREARTASDPDDPTNSEGCRVYTIGVGAHPNVEMEMDPEGGGPVQATITYMCEKVRDYEIFQPPGDEALDVVSTSANDDSQTLTIEADDGTSEEVALTGDTAVTTTSADWSSIRALELDAECEGDVTVSLSGSGDELATIRGAAYYDQGDGLLEGDLGVPAVGAGALASEVGGTWEYARSVTVERGGSEFEFDIASSTFTCENEFEAQPRQGSTRTRYDEGNRMATIETDLIGWGASAQLIEEGFGGAAQDVAINLGKSTITLNTARISELDDRERGPEDANIVFGASFEPSDDGGIDVTQVA